MADPPDRAIDGQKRRAGLSAQVILSGFATGEPHAGHDPPRASVALVAVGCGGDRSPPAAGGAGSQTAAAAAPLRPRRPNDTAGLLRVRFARGTTSGIVNDSLLAGETRGYLIGADQGQVMMVHAITWPVRQGSRRPRRRRCGSLRGGRRRELPRAAGRGGLWSGRLPPTGDYIVRVSASEPTAYTLAVQIPRPL